MDLITFHAFFNLLTTNAGRTRSFFEKTRVYGPSIALGYGKVSQVDRVSSKAARKRTEVAFCGANKVSREYIKPFISELLILLNSDLREHHHIVNLVGFEWEVEHMERAIDHRTRIAPVIELEYAVYGILAQFLKIHPLSRFLKVRQAICHQVGLGLLA